MKQRSLDLTPPQPPTPGRFFHGLLFYSLVPVAPLSSMGGLGLERTQIAVVFKI